MPRRSPAASFLGAGLVRHHILEPVPPSSLTATRAPVDTGSVSSTSILLTGPTDRSGRRRPSFVSYRRDPRPRPQRSCLPVVGARTPPPPWAPVRSRSWPRPGSSHCAKRPPSRRWRKRWATETSVGVRVQFDHLAPVKVGSLVTAEAILEKVEGRASCSPSRPLTQPGWWEPAGSPGWSWTSRGSSPRPAERRPTETTSGGGPTRCRRSLVFGVLQTPRPRTLPSTPPTTPPPTASARCLVPTHVLGQSLGQDRKGHALKPDVPRT